MDKQFYTYLHCLPDGSPFYVGKGSGRRSGAFACRNSDHKNIVAKYGRENIGVFIFQCESEIQAYNDEIQQVTQLRNCGYQLMNQTDGGGGINNPTPESRAKMSAAKIGKKFSEQHRANISLAFRGNKRCLGYKHTDEAKANMANAAKGNSNRRGKCASPSTIAKLVGNKNCLGRKLSEITKQKMSDANKGRKLSDEHRKNLSLSHKGKPWSKERRDAIKGKPWSVARRIAQEAKQ